MSTKKNNSPLVSVLLPVYNSSAYLASAIDSIINQTFTDFELLIINDGSTDNSPEIISSFTDDRIKIINNEKNLGLIASLNKGIYLAHGKYIARMDSDDISVPERFAKQVKYLQQNLNVAVLATRTDLMNADGEITGEWNDDTKYIHEKDIRKAMAFSNCIAHPSIMARADVLRKYKYKTYQKGSEDWDLWLRILADSHIIHKLDEILLHYRIHPQSIMTEAKKALSLQQRLIKTKRIFLVHQLPKINGYFFLVKYSLLRSIASHIKYNLLPVFLRNIKRTLTCSPFTVLSQYNKLKKTLSEHQTDNIFCFPYTHVGGAEVVHSEIVKVCKDKKPLTIFTNFSANKNFLSLFSENSTVLNIPEVLNYPTFRKKCVKLLADYINNKKSPVVFGSNTQLLFDLLPYMTNNVKCIDLIHAFTYAEKGNLDHLRMLPFAQRLNNRVFISGQALAEFKLFYHKNNFTGDQVKKLILIPNYADIPKEKPVKKSEKIRILFVGRYSEEKRFNLFVKICEKLYNLNKERFEFTVIGPIQAESYKNFPFLQFTGELLKREELNTIYKTTDILLITSYREGFPMVIMEAMAYGVVPICTPVGDIPAHINTNNGFVTSSIDENNVLKEMTEKIESLSRDKTNLNTLSENAYNYASANFSKEKFVFAYKALLNL